MTGQAQRTKLELYGKVIAAHQEATFSQLQRKAFWHLVEKKSWFYLFLFLLPIIIHIQFSFALVLVFLYHALEKIYMITFLLITFALLIIAFGFIAVFRYILAKSLRSYFDTIGCKYGSLIKAFGGNWEFYSYLLFRDELNDRKFTPQDVEEVRPLLDLEQQTLGAYVARNPLHSWIYATSGATIAASATNWPPKILALVVCFSFLALIILHFIPTLITNQRRQYELHRWLAWYEADVSKSTAANLDSANLLPG